MCPIGVPPDARRQLSKIVRSSMRSLSWQSVCQTNIGSCCFGTKKATVGPKKRTLTYVGNSASSLVLGRQFGSSLDLGPVKWPSNSAESIEGVPSNLFSASAIVCSEKRNCSTGLGQHRAWLESRPQTFRFRRALSPTRPGPSQFVLHREFRSRATLPSLARQAPSSLEIKVEDRLFRDQNPGSTFTRKANGGRPRRRAAVSDWHRLGKAYA